LAFACIPLLVVGFGISYLLAFATEEGPATGIAVQQTLTLVGMLACLTAIVAAVAHVIGGGRRSLLILSLLGGASLLLTIAVLVGQDAWCAHCGAR
jgi:hypothetical protein